MPAETFVVARAQWVLRITFVGRLCERVPLDHRLLKELAYVLFCLNRFF